jgi:hypothetical protein
VQHLKNLNVTGGTVTTNSLIDTAGLSITGSGTLDQTGDMIVRQGNLATITDLIRRARANGGWTGPGLTSSAARADAQHITTLGILLNDDGAGQPIYTSFAGQNVDHNSILIRYTYTGDLDLDLDIDADDYAMIDAGYATHSEGYQFGDINLDGTINADDYFLIDRAFSDQGSLAGTIYTTTVPGPSIIFILALGMIFVARAPRP